MQKDLYVKEPFPVRHDDLKFDGTNIIIPFYWASSIEEYLSKVNTNGMEEADVEDLKELKAFVSDVLDYRNNPNNYKTSSYHFEGTN
jgi:hypothetical protein